MRTPDSQSVSTAAAKPALFSKQKFMLFALLSAGTLLLCSQLLAAEANPYAKNYKAQNTSQLKSLSANPDTKMLLSNHKEDDNISMLEDGYDMMG